MPKEFSRVERVADQIQKELAVMVQREIKDPRLGMVTINAVKVSRDLGYADVYISLLTTEELTEADPVVQDSLGVLRKAAGFLRSQLGRAMKLRVIPQLRFHFDTLGGQSRRIDSLIDRAVGRKPAVGRSDDSGESGD
ncbi:30S ribosome-binding factor RbfA [Marinobacter halodurans]|uniref:Ribosome-binding factor A n=1 Tax=Marinobacter halodurans TaxID=2528979 RepID=A0ABY1ZEG3_9GAMM|nr:30S ribosome-binding factor RbfA [Marinobacter halodurans]TBW48413.1 30S ribosome-binding factor RbfA [Marinobacter halodurans]